MVRVATGGDTRVVIRPAPVRGDALLPGRRGACGALIDPPQRLGVGDLLGGGEFAGRLLAGIAAVFRHGMLVSGGFPRSAGR